MSKKPSPKITMAKTADLIPYARNSRTHSEEQVIQIASSIKEFGFTNPVLTDGDGGIIAGHGRVMAAKKLGLDEVPTISLAHLTDAQRKAYVIADNKLALNAGWDEELLALELSDLQEMDFDIGLIGFDAEELTELLAETPESEGDGNAEEGGAGSLAEKFGLPPFTILNAREGWWQDRKRAWLLLGIRSELGRGEGDYHAAPGGSVMVSGYDKNGKRLTGLKNINK